MVVVVVVVVVVMVVMVVEVDYVPQAIHHPSSQILEQIKQVESQTAAALGYNPYESQTSSNHAAKAAIEKTLPGPLAANNFGSSSSTTTTATTMSSSSSGGGGNNLPLPLPPIPNVDSFVPDYLLEDPNVSTTYYSFYYYY